MHYSVAIILLQIHSYKSIPFESVSEFWVLDRAMLQRRGAQIRVAHAANARAQPLPLRCIVYIVYGGLVTHKEFIDIHCRTFARFAVAMAQDDCNSAETIVDTSSTPLPEAAGWAVILGSAGLSNPVGRCRVRIGEYSVL